MVIKSPRRWRLMNEHGGAFRTPNKSRPALEVEMKTGGGRLRRSAPPACRSRVTADTDSKLRAAHLIHSRPGMCRPGRPRGPRPLLLQGFGVPHHQGDRWDSLVTGT